jgi:hypothetical protein
MARRRFLTGALIAAGTAAAAVVLRRRGSRPQARIELYFEDGTLTTIESGAPGSERMLALAREALSAARPTL